MTRYIEVSGDNGKNTSEILNIKHEIIIVKMYESISLWTVSGQDSWGAVRPSWVAEYPRQCKLRCKVSPGPGPAYPAPSGNLPMLSIFISNPPPFRSVDVYKQTSETKSLYFDNLRGQ